MEIPIQLVIVLYQKNWLEVGAARAIEEYVQKNKSSQVLIYDNSPMHQEELFFCEKQVTYVHDAQNPGLAVPYNQALEHANKAHLPWLILLDQDTVIDRNYFQIIEEQLKQSVEVVCHLPQVVSNDKQISPLLADKYIDRNWDYPKLGVERRRVMGINSASVWQTRFLNTIGGFSTEFPLDFLDHWLFYQVHLHQRLVNIVSVTINHNLSVLNYGTMSISRYQKILKAERKYYQRIEPQLFDRHKKQLKLRMMKQFIIVRNRAIWKVTWREYRVLRKDKL